MTFDEWWNQHWLEKFSGPTGEPIDHYRAAWEAATQEECRANWELVMFGDTAEAPMPDDWEDEYQAAVARGDIEAQTRFECAAAIRARRV